MKRILYALAILLACNAGIGAFAQTTGEAQAPTNNFVRYPDTTSGTPSLAPLGSGSNPKLYIAYRANDPSGLLWINATQDGINLAGASVQNGIYMGSDPSLTSVTGSHWMWIAYKATNNDSLWVCRGSDGDTTNNTTTRVAFSCFYNVTKIHMIGAPSILAARDSTGLVSLWVAWRTSAADSHGANHLAITKFTEDAAPGYNTHVYDTLIASSPSITLLNGNIIAAFESNDSTNSLTLQTFAYDLSSSQPPYVYGPRIGNAPGLTVASYYTGVYVQTMITASQDQYSHHLVYDTYLGSMFTGFPVQNDSTMGSGAGEAYWYPINGNTPAITTAYKANDSGNNLWLGTQTVVFNR